MHRKLIKHIISEGSHSDMDEMEELLIELIDHLKMTDHHKYLQAEHELYKIVHHNHLSEELAHHWVSNMHNKDGTKGGHWSLEETSKYSKHHNKYDWYAVMNMIYSDFYNPRFDTATYIELAEDWLADKDIDECKLLNYYFKVVKDTE